MINRKKKLEKKYPKALIIVFVLLFGTSLSCFTLGQGLGRVTRYSIQNGLSFGVVNSIAQDDKGFVWFATGDGLNRFDGYTFKVFKHNPEDKFSLLGNYVKSILKDKDGTIWVSSRSGLNEFVPEKEHFLHHVPSLQKRGISDDVSDISHARNGDLWISLNSFGFAAFNKKNKRFRYYNQKTLPGLVTNSILNAFEDSKGLLWLGTRDTGIEIFDIDKNRGSQKIGYRF